MLYYSNKHIEVPSCRLWFFHGVSIRCMVNIHYDSMYMNVKSMVCLHAVGVISHSQVTFIICIPTSENLDGTDNLPHGLSTF